MAWFINNWLTHNIIQLNINPLLLMSTNVYDGAKRKSIAIKFSEVM